MKRYLSSSPAAAAALATEYVLLAAEAQTVIAMRLLGMGGFWNTTEAENKRMVEEKPTALMRSGWAMWRAALSGRPAEDVLLAGLVPLRRRTRANVRRLSRRGPAIPGPKR